METWLKKVEEVKKLRRPTNQETTSSSAQPTQNVQTTPSVNPGTALMTIEILF